MELKSETLDVSGILQLAGESLPVYEEHDYREPLEAYLTLDQDGHLGTAALERGAREDIAHGRTLAFKIDPAMSGDEIIGLVKENLDALEDIHLGHEVAWDGSNYVGSLTEEAQDLVYSLNPGHEKLRFGESESRIVYRPYDFVPGLEVWKAGETLDAAVSRIEAEMELIEDSGAAIYRNGNDCESELLMAAELAFNDGDVLTPHQLQALRENNIVSNADQQEQQLTALLDPACADHLSSGCL